MHSGGTAGHSPAPRPWRTLEPARGWAELLVAPGVDDVLRKLVAETRERFTRPESGAVMALFTGDTGTGKTLAARVIAAELGVPAVEVDSVTAASHGVAALAATVWQVLHEAQIRRSVVVFEDAGAVLGRRTAHRTEFDSTDISARCAGYPGLVIFCSRVGLRFDGGRPEQLSAVVEFPFPEPPVRAQLWRRWLGSQARVSESDIEFLADSFRLAGGSIHSCVRIAERRAREQDRAVNRADLAHALHSLYSRWVLSAATETALAALSSGEELSAPATTTAQAGPAEPSPTRARRLRLPRPRRDG